MHSAKRLNKLESCISLDWYHKVLSLCDCNAQLHGADYLPRLCLHSRRLSLHVDLLYLGADWNWFLRKDELTCNWRHPWSWSQTQKTSALTIYVIKNFKIDRSCSSSISLFSRFHRFLYLKVWQAYRLYSKILDRQVPQNPKAKRIDKRPSRTAQFSEVGQLPSNFSQTLEVCEVFAKSGLRNLKTQTSAYTSTCPGRKHTWT